VALAGRRRSSASHVHTSNGLAVGCPVVIGYG
jgi:hypothetical protein